jgi:predicted nucleic acid-binding protein
MIIADTSIWVDYFKKENPDFSRLIEDQQISLHPYVYGELLLGGLPSDQQLEDDFSLMPVAPVATVDEVNAFIRWAGLTAAGIGYVDTHLLISARLIPGARLWTTDKNLAKQARKLELEYTL